MQPPCEDEGCYAAVGIQEPPPAPPKVSHAGDWVLLAAVLVALVGDLVLVKLHLPTASQDQQRRVKRWVWWGVVLVVGFALLTWHLVWGFPGKDDERVP